MDDHELMAAKLRDEPEHAPQPTYTTMEKVYREFDKAPLVVQIPAMFIAGNLAAIWWMAPYMLVAFVLYFLTVGIFR